MSAHNRKNTRSVDVIADYFLMKVNSSAGDTISNLKLQKLCYFAQAAALVHLNQRLFDDEIQAWAPGPVIKKLYSRFRKYSWQAIDPSDLRVSKKHSLTEDEKALLDKVWEELSGYSGKKLEMMAHEDGAWKKNYTSNVIGGRCENVISTRSIKNFYSSSQKPKWIEQIDFSRN